MINIDIWSTTYSVPRHTEVHVCIPIVLSLIVPNNKVCNIIYGMVCFIRNTHELVFENWP